jgi:hypothetical protein
MSGNIGDLRVVYINFTISQVSKTSDVVQV